MKGITKDRFANSRSDPMKIILTIYKLKLPKEILNKIVKFSVPLMYCSKCEVVLQKNNNKKNIGWNIYNDSILCKQCTPSLKELYYKHIRKPPPRA